MKSICRQCGRIVESKEILRNGRVYLERTCPEHGKVMDLISSDSDFWDWARNYDRPGSQPFRWSSTFERGCPDDCGICPEHKQHTCVAIIEVTGVCNLKCPICFAEAPYGPHLPFDEIVQMIDTFVSHESNPEILQFSGGEPLLHPQITDLVKYAKELGIEDVVISTNGLSLRSGDLARKMADLDAVIYLQFDTFRPEVSTLMRGQDLVQEKMKVVDICNDFNITTVLVPTLVRGLNDDEIGELVEFAISMESVFGVNFQPVATVGRFDIQDTKALTIHEILTMIQDQTKGRLEVSDFRPIPCPHPHCTSICYLLSDEEEVIPLTDIVDVDEYIDYGKDRTLVSKSILREDAFEGLFSTSAVPGSERTLDAFCEACDIKLPDFQGKSVKAISIHAFMARTDYQLERAQKCCIHIVQPDGKLIPFCNFNHFYRGGESNE